MAATICPTGSRTLKGPTPWSSLRTTCPSSNNVLGVRVKDAVVQHGARLITVSQRGNPLEDFARDPALALRPERGDTAATVQAIVTELLKDAGLRERAAAMEGLEELPPVDAPGAADAAQALLAGVGGTVAVVLAPSRVSGTAAAAQARAAANLAIVLAGPEAAAASLHVLPPEANTLGLRDMGVTPGPDSLGRPRHADGGARGHAAGNDHREGQSPDAAAGAAVRSGRRWKRWTCCWSLMTSLRTLFRRPPMSCRTWRC